MTQTKTEIANITGKALKSVEAWQQGHFILTSGKHSEEYMQCQKVMQYPRLGNLLADLLIDKVFENSIQPDVVVGPALGAIHWELYVAQALERYKLRDNNKVLEPSKDTASSITRLEEITSNSKEDIENTLTKAVFAEKVKNESGEVEFEIRRGIELDKGTKVLVVEDVTTTGGSARKVVELIKSIGSEPVAVGAVVDRSGGTAQFDVPFISLLQLNLETYDSQNCPLCQKGTTAVKPGSPNK